MKTNSVKHTLSSKAARTRHCRISAAAGPAGYLIAHAKGYQSRIIKSEHAHAAAVRKQRAGRLEVQLAERGRRCCSCVALNHELGMRPGLLLAVEEVMPSFPMASRALRARCNEDMASANVCS